MQRRAAALLFGALCLRAQIEADVAASTATQALLIYRAPDESPCRVEVSESPDFTPLVNDVNPALFPGSDLDSRPGNIVRGRDRWFVVGKRTVEQAASLPPADRAAGSGRGARLAGLNPPAPQPRRYSRALQAFTDHYYRIHCGGDVVTGRFQTANPRLGDTSPLVPPFDPGAFGNYGWPTMDPANRAQQTVDPLTGVLLKRFTLPGDRGRITANEKFGFVLDLHRAWSDPAHAGSGVPDQRASYSGTAGDPLFLGLDPAVFRPDYSEAGGWYPWATVDDLRLRAFGSGSDRDPENRTLLACISIDSGQSCATGELELVLAHSGSGPAAVPRQFPAPMFQGWGAAVSRGLFGPRRGLVDVVGNAVTLAGLDAPAYFQPAWSPGTRLFIAGSAPACPANACTVREVLNATRLSIVENPGVLKHAQYWALSSGLRVRKKTATGSVEASFNFDFAWSPQAGLPITGEAEVCAPKPATTTVDADGNRLPNGQSLTGYVCKLGALYFVVPETGEVRLISRLRYSGSISGPEPDQTPYSAKIFIETPFDPDRPNVLYAAAEANARGGQKRQCIFRVTYTGDYRAYGAPYSEAAPEPLKWENITPPSRGKDVLSQIQQANPGWDVSRWGTLLNNRGLAVSGRYFVFMHGAAGAGQDAPCWLHFFDVTAHPYAVLTKSVNSFSDPSLRWAGCHTGGPMFGDYVRLSAKVIGADGARATNTLLGPHGVFFTAMRKEGQWSADTSLSADYAEGCPADLDGRWIEAGATGARCIFARVRGEPCSVTPNTAAGENVHFPCPWDSRYSMLQPMEEGDWMEDQAAPADEKLRLVRKTPLPGGGFELVLQRFVACNTQGRAKADGWVAQMSPIGICRAADAVVSGSPDQHGWIRENLEVTSVHHDTGAGRTPGRITTVMAGYAVRADGAVPDSFGQEPNIRMAGFGSTFAGSSGGIPGAHQSYPSKKQWNAPPDEQDWFLDFRALNPSAGAVPESSGSSVAGITIAPVEGLTQVYETANVGPFDPKRIPLWGYAGPYLLREKSGPARGDSFTDADEWRFCVANAAGECRSNSSRGDIFVNVPKADLTGRCLTNQYARRTPCVLTPQPYTGFAVQWDLSRNDPLGVNFRRLTMGLSGPGRQYHYANIRALPDGSWAIVPGYWLDGLRCDLLLAKLPPWPGRHPGEPDASSFVEVRVPAPPDRAYPYARVRFGYAENGAPERFFCTPREEACSTGGTPFAWESEDPEWQACAAGCTIAAPAYFGRMLYYALDRKNEAGQIRPGDLRVAAVSR